MPGLRPMNDGPPPKGSRERPGYDAQIALWAASAVDVSGLSPRVRADVLAKREADAKASAPDGAPAPNYLPR